MSAAPQPIFTAPFDAVAERYDETFTSSIIGRAQRAMVWKELEKTFRAGDRVLEIGCGTGADACFLADRGVYVTATDASAQMIEVTSRRIRTNGLDNFAHPHVLPAENISLLGTTEPFEGALSNFGALNCVNDLQQLAADLAGFLRPGAKVFLCWMGPYCVWEMLSYALKGNWTKAFRRLRRKGVTAKLTDGALIHVQYPSADSLVRCFAPWFRLRSLQGVGIAVPPSYIEPWAQRHPRLLQFFERIDSRINRWPGVRLLGDHILVCLERRVD
jgi:ubiquinone/menaquinone biosynthesis C-methylase UbiE